VASRSQLFSRRRFLGLAASAAFWAGQVKRSDRNLDEGLPPDVITPQDPRYDWARRDANARIDDRPALIVYCRTASEVARCVRWADRHDMPVAVRSGGHDYEGFSLNDGGLVVDTSLMREIRIDERTGSATLGAGTRLGDAYGTLASAGWTLPGGVSPGVGISGLTTGGGYGLLARWRGLLCDSLRRVTLVDGAGEIHDSARDERGGDILWACQGGGGGSFGVVTSLEFSLVRLPGRVTRFSFLWAWEDDVAASILDAWLRASQESPRGITSVLTFAGGSPRTIRCFGLSVGEESALRAFSARLERCQAPRRRITVSEPLWPALQSMMGTPAARQSWKMKSSFGDRPLAPAAIARAVRHMAEQPSDATCILAFEALGGAVQDIAPDATAFPHRRSLFLLQYQTYWNRPAAAAGAFSWVRRAFADIDPYTARASYRNYSDLDLSDWPQRYFAANYPRLQRIKAALDPRNLFRFPQSIRLPEGNPPAAIRPR
jgi:FAD/FMN-containing dehydrogenase